MINRKWGILCLLYQLARPASETIHASRVTQPHHTESRSFQNDLHQNSANNTDRDDEEKSTVVHDAVASPHIPRLPLRQTDHNGVNQDGGNPDGSVGSDEKAQQMTPSNASLMTDAAVLKQREMAERPSEATLLRHLPFTLQGLSSTNLQFGPMSSLSLPPNRSLPLISLLHTLAEPSLLYRNLSEFVKSKDEGLIGQKGLSEWRKEV